MMENFCVKYEKIIERKLHNVNKNFSNLREDDPTGCSFYPVWEQENLLTRIADEKA